MIRRRRSGEPRGIGECGETNVLARPHNGQALFHVGSIETCERHHIGNCCQSYEIEKCQKIRLAYRLIKSAPPQFARHCDKNQEHDARRTQCPLPRHVVLAVRVDDRFDFGEALVSLVVIDDEDVGAETPRQRQRFVACRTAIDRDDQPGALGDQCLDGTGVRPIALKQAIRDVNPRRRFVVRQKPRHQCRRAGSVNVIVAKNRNGLPAFNRIGEARCGLVHVTQMAWIRHQRFERRIEERRHIVEPDAAGGEHATHQLRQAVALGYRRGERLRSPTGGVHARQIRVRWPSRREKEAARRRFRSHFLPDLPCAIEPAPLPAFKVGRPSELYVDSPPKRPENAQAPTANRGPTTYAA